MAASRGLVNYDNPSQWHEAANLFPMLPVAELENLAEDIKANGLLNPIALFEGKVLDGRNRLLACQLAGVEPIFVELVSAGVSAVDWVISQNLMRRQLTAGQLAAVAIDAKPFLAEEARKNQSAAGKMFGRGIASVKNDESYPETIDTRKQLSERFGVSEGYLHASQKIKDMDCALFERVKAGTVTIADAQRQLGFEQITRQLTSSESNEWYTPPEPIEAARAVLGRIDLDPASCELANSIVKAGVFYTEADDGLEKPWHGKVWLNPPYGDVGPKFVAKLIREYEAGRVTEAILLVNSNSNDADWFQPLWRYPHCFTSPRLRFWNEDGVGNSPTHGSAFFYLGPAPEVFAEHFRRFGYIAPVNLCSTCAQLSYAVTRFWAHRMVSLGQPDPPLSSVSDLPYVS